MIEENDEMSVRLHNEMIMGLRDAPKQTPVLPIMFGTHMGNLVAIRADGSVWMLVHETDKEWKRSWERLPDVPLPLD